MGGKVIVFGGDFRQILPVVPRGNHSDIVHASLNVSYIWGHCEILKLTKKHAVAIHELKQFSDWLLDIGDGKLGQPNDGYSKIIIL